MGFSDKLKDMLNQGMELSKDFIDKASVKAKELGELGVMKWEILQLQGQAKKVAAQLGVEVYAALVDEGKPSVGLDSPGIGDTVKKLDQLEKDIDAREEEYKRRGGKSEDLSKPMA
jgi:hypothetical protein